jgi:hypothetical protein
MPDKEYYDSLLQIVNRLACIEQKVTDVKEDIGRQEIEMKEIFKNLSDRVAKTDKKVEANTKIIWMAIGGFSTIIMVIQVLSAFGLI